MGIGVPALRQLLYRTSLEHVIRYIPADHSDVIFLHHGRLRPGNVLLQPERYKMLQESYRETTEAIVEYASEDDVCRSRFLLDYFGQEESAYCGHCDICRERAKKPQDLASRLKAFIKAPYTLADVRAAFGTADSAWEDVLRDLIDRGEVPNYDC
jgi:ATP-dependent DNA helicase RecQ